MGTNAALLMSNHIEDEISRLMNTTKEFAVHYIYIESERYKKAAIRRLGKSLDLLSAKLEQLNNSLYMNLNHVDDEIIRESLLPDLENICILFSSLLGNVYAKGLNKYCDNSIAKYVDQYSILAEIVYDLKNIRLARNNELDMLLKQVNSFK